MFTGATHLVAEGLDLALCQLFAIIQLFYPLVEFLEGRLLLHRCNLRNDFERVFNDRSAHVTEGVPAVSPSVLD